MADGILDFFSREAGQRRRRELGEAISYYVPPELRGLLGLVEEMTPIRGAERAGRGAQRVADPNVRGWNKVAAIGDTTSEIAGVVAPAAVASRGAMPVANAVEEVFTGYSPMVQPFLVDDYGGMKLYRGDTGSSERITNGIGEGLLFGTPYEDVARLYGDNISQFELPDGARVLTEGSKEFAQITGRKRGPLLRNLRPGENLTGAANDAIEKARAAGYDAVEFNSMRDMGVAVLNPSIVRSAPTDPAIQRGFRAFHGSPHDFDRFDMSKIGTGEGAQAYGHGLYFAESEDVARAYRESLTAANDIERSGNVIAYSAGGLELPTAMKPEADIAHKMQQYGIDPNTPDGAEWLSMEIGARNMAGSRDIDLALVDRLFRGAPLDTRWMKGRMYEVQINADPNDFLDWDKPLSEQPQVLQRLGMSARPEQEIHDEALRLMTEGNAREQGKMWFDYPELQARIDELQSELDRRVPNVTGQEYYRGGANDDVAGILSQMGYGNPEVQSQALREAGIPGIRYLDAGSRGAGDGSRNYVVFDDKLIDIVRKYGIAGAAAMLGMSQYDVAQAMEQQQPQGLLFTGAQ